MKVIPDDELSLLHLHTQKIAKTIAKNEVKSIISQMEECFKNDDKFGDLTYMGAMTFINTIGVNIFTQIFEYSCWVGKQFPDVGHCSRELFEELIQGLRFINKMPEINKKEYPGGIKKVSISEEPSMIKNDCTNSVTKDKNYYGEL